MKTIITYLFLATMLLIGCGKGKVRNEPIGTKELTIQLKGKKYDQLFLQAALNGPNHSAILKLFEGHSTDGYKWNFHIPDSVAECVVRFVILPELFDFKTNTAYLACFRGLNEDTTHFYDYVFDEKHPFCEATYQETKEIKTAPDDYMAVNDTAIAVGATLLRDIFKVDSKEKATDLELSIRFSSFSFMDMNNYDLSLKEKDSISRKFPDSKYLMSQFYGFFNELKSIDDTKKIFNNFSEENKTNWFGRRIGNIIKLYSSKFENSSLTNSASGLTEPIIVDSTKFNLIIFSASWCAPCHKLIPILKEVYDDLNANLDMAYVSIDEKKYVDQWKELMKEKSIPWRSLLAVGHVKEIEDKYDASSLPHMLIVYPDKSVKKNRPSKRSR